MTRDLHTETFCLSGAWVFEQGVELVVLRRPADGTVIELTDLDIEQLASLWSALAEPHTVAELHRRVEPFGVSGGELLELFRAEGVLRPLAEPTPLINPEAGVLPELVTDLGRHGGWKIGALQCFSFADLLRAPAQHADAEVGLACLENQVIAVQLGCAYCALLRTLGVMGEPGQEQTAIVRSAPLGAPHDLRAMIAMALASLQAAPLTPAEGLWVRLDEGLSRGQVLEHPDCPRCAARPRSPKRAGALGDFRREVAPIARVERISRALGESPFSPLRLDEVTGVPDSFPSLNPTSSETRA